MTEIIETTVNIDPTKEFIIEFNNLIGIKGDKGDPWISTDTKISDLTDDTATTPIAKADTLTGLTATVEELNQLSEKVLGDIITHDDSEYAKPADIPTKISDLTDDTATTPIDKADNLTGLTATVEELNQLSEKVLGDIITHDTSEFGKNTIIGNAEPESETEGEVGQFYLNNTNNNLYQCTSFDNETSTYTWIKIDKAAVCGFYPTTNTPAEVGQIIKSTSESSNNISLYICVLKNENGKTSWKRIQFVEFAYSPIGLAEVPTEQTSTQNIGQIVYATSDPGEIYISVNYNPPYKWRKLAFKDDLLQKLSGFTLLNQTLTFTLNSTTNKYECTISNENVTNDSLVDVYFKTEYVGIAETAVINVESQTGRILITADNNPSSTLVCSIKVV